MHRRSVFYFLTNAGLAELYQAVMGLPGARRSARGLLVSGAVLAACGVYHVARQPFSPSDWVDVTMRNVPPGLRQIYLIADGRDGPRALNWYHSKVYAFTDDPRRSGQQWYWNRPEGQRFAPVQWPHAERYGALAQRPDGAWELWWFGPGDLEGPSAARYIFGGGTAEVRLPNESRTVSPTPEFLKQVGLPDQPDTS